MYKTLIAAVAMVATTAHAEIPYDYTNKDHVADNQCVAVISIIRDELYNDVQISNGMVFLKTVANTDDVKALRSQMADLSNHYMLKYEYSKQFNDHYKVKKMLIKQEHGPAYIQNELEKCM